LKRDLTLLKR